MKGTTLAKLYALCLVGLVFSMILVGCSHTSNNAGISNDQSSASNSNTDVEASHNYILPPIKTAPIKAIHVKPKNKDQLIIWQNIEENLALTEYYEHPHVILHKQKYLANVDYLSTVTKRSEPFIYYILSEINKRQLPAELAILPIVESGYVPIARSRAKATGLWQFMSFTAKEFGLERTWGYDGRHDISASTTAALDYLEHLHNEFNGDWLLALAAYNAGPHRVKRAMLSQEAKHGDKQFWDLRLPRETREYVPKILALSAIVSEDELCSTLFYPIANEPYLDKITIKKRISYAKILENTEINSAELNILNPALRNHNYPIPEGYTLLVPKDDVELVSSTVETLPEEEKFVSGKHTIRRGESLSHIAVQYDTSVRALCEVNNIRGHKIIAGRTLIIPAFPSNGKRIKNSNKDGSNVYIVTPGDSFWKIAHRNNTTVDRLVEINGRNPNKPLHPGEAILID